MAHANALLPPGGPAAAGPVRRRARLAPPAGGRPLSGLGDHHGPLAGRYRQRGEPGMADRSSRPRRSPRRTPTRLERRIIKVRVVRRWGPARIGFLLGLHPSTVHRVLSRYGLARLAWLERPTCRVIRRYEHAASGDLVHMDVKKLGRIPPGGGWRITAADYAPAPTAGWATRSCTPRWTITPGWPSPSCSPTRARTPPRHSGSANAYFAACGITVRRVLTDNGNCYQSFACRDALGGVAHIRTRPYRPQTNGKAERFNRTLVDEWAYIRPFDSSAERTAALPVWLHTYNRRVRLFAGLGAAG